MSTWLFVPGHETHKLRKALASRAGVVIIAIGCGSFFGMAGASPATTRDGHEVGTSYSLCVV